ncbi:MAG: hypothetical protein JNL11_04540 [Bdellovibrionaceae bacterium]|nr:hypothetical protein [Pseudobdellovibrionaceae bacterium]
MKYLFIFLLIFSVGYAQLRTPQGAWSSLERVSPLNDKNYFEIMNTHADKLTSIAKKQPKLKLKQIKLVGVKNTLRSYADGRKFFIPERMDVRDSFAEGLNRSVPAYIPPSQNEGEVIKFFGDKMIQNWLASDVVKSSSFGKAASSVEKAMKVEASISGPPTAPGAKAIDHRFSFQYLALQSQAKMEYRGWTQAQFRHDSRNSETTIEFSEKVFKNKDLVVNHTKNSIENRSSLGLRWSW